MGSGIHRLSAAYGSGNAEWNLFLVNEKKAVNVMAAPGVFLIQTQVQTFIPLRCSTQRSGLEPLSRRGPSVAMRLILLPNMLGSQTLLTRIPALPDQSPYPYLYVHCSTSRFHLARKSRATPPSRLLHPATGALEPAAPRSGCLTRCSTTSCRTTRWPTSSVLPPCTGHAVHSCAGPRHARRQLRTCGCPSRASCTTTHSTVSRARWCADGILVLVGAPI